jgi:DNA-binding beta-propeller fold protein YncE
MPDMMQVAYNDESDHATAHAQFGGGPDYSGTAEGPVLDRDPIRTIRDVDPIYSGVGVNHLTDEVILGDNNLWAIRVFNRTENTPAGVAASTPKRVIHGPKSEIQFINGMYIDPANGDIYTVETDTGDKVTVFDQNANGDVPAKRKWRIPHRGFSLAVDEAKNEIYIGVHYPPEIAVFDKNARDEDKPKRSIQGESTRLAYVHGMAVDTKNNRMFVANWGRVSHYTTAGTGRFEDPSITVYPLNANGDTAPTTVISGNRTQLNWPAQMSINPNTGEIYVANDMGHSVLVFKSTDSGNVAPTRVIKGDRTGLSYPHGIYIDTKNNELWVTNFGKSSATVYPLMANGNVAPLRTIRSAPANKVSLKFGKVEALAYDRARDQVWVPNCVTHPQIAAFARTARENEPPVRTLEGHNTKLSRTMHGFSYDGIHDEIVVNSPLAQAILTFRGAANGEEPPIRVIQGRNTKILGQGYGALSTVTADPENNEIFLPVGGGGYRDAGTNGPTGVLVFNRTDNGDVAPKRFLNGPDTGIRQANSHVAVDHRANVLIVKDSGALSIFNRTADGNTRPLRIIRGPKTGGFGGGQMATYPEKGWIVVNSLDGYAVWHVNDNGDVAPRWRIPVKEIVGRVSGHPSGGRQNVGVALIPHMKEIMVSSSQSNRVVTFYFPEMFDATSTNNN